MSAGVLSARARARARPALLPVLGPPALTHKREQRLKLLGARHGDFPKIGRNCAVIASASNFMMKNMLCLSEKRLN